MSRNDDRPRHTHLTGRAAILAVVVCAIVLSLAAPLREYIAQRARIAQLRAENQQMQEQIGELRKRERRLNDPDYIKRLARERLHYVMPGQTNYIVVDGAQGLDGVTDDLRRDAAGRPWFVNLWKSVEKADEVDTE